MADGGQMMLAKVAEATAAMTKLLTFLGMDVAAAKEYAGTAVLAAYHYGRDHRGDTPA